MVDGTYLADEVENGRCLGDAVGGGMLPVVMMNGLSLVGEVPALLQYYHLSRPLCFLAASWAWH